MAHNYRVYTGTGPKEQSENQRSFPKRRSLEDYPKNYTPDPGLIEAVNLAIVMNQPLLLTGDPGTGKTQLAYHVAWELGLEKPLKFETRSTSLSRDLFYYFNSVGLFHAPNNPEASKRAADYITYNALGLAILKSKVINEDDVQLKKILPADFNIANHKPTRSVVLIDEVDKAPRDFPNDILNQIENLYFRIPELDNALVVADRENAPITIITSNSEKNLPNAFLRRCIFYHITFPKKEVLQKIALNRLNDLKAEGEAGPSDIFLREGVDLFLELCSDKNQIKKKPATAEMIVWFDALRRLSSTPNNPVSDGNCVLNTLGAVIKENEDRALANTIVRRWLTEKQYSFNL